MKVVVPGGVDTGLRLKLSGQSEVGAWGGPAGDLYVEILVNEHPSLKRSGDDLHLQISIPVTAATLGCSVSIPSLDGNKSLKVPAGIQPGTVLSIKNLGATHLRGSGRGDLLVHVMVEVPKDVDTKQKKLLEELAKLRGEEEPTAKITTELQNDSFFTKLKDAFGR